MGVNLSTQERLDTLKYGEVPWTGGGPVVNTGVPVYVDDNSEFRNSFYDSLSIGSTFLKTKK